MPDGWAEFLHIPAVSNLFGRGAGQDYIYDEDTVSGNDKTRFKIVTREQRVCFKKHSDLRNRYSGYDPICHIKKASFTELRAKSFTGHSLGGGLASVMAVWFDRPAYAFAPAPFEKSADSTQSTGLFAQYFSPGVMPTVQRKLVVTRQQARYSNRRAR